MSSYFTCAAYEDVKTEIRIGEKNIYLKVKSGGDDIHITLNPLQVAALSKNLFAALSKIEVEKLVNEKYLGNLTVIFEIEHPDAKEEKIPVGCYENEWIYDDFKVA